MDKYGQMSKWNGSMGLLSIGILLIFSFIPWIISEDDESWFAIAITLYAIIWMFTVIAMWHIPLEISVSNSIFRINFPLRKKSFPINELKSASVYHVSKSLVAKFGCRYYFGWWGNFYDRNIGSLYLYASNLDELVLIELNNGKKYIVSCTDAQSMVDSINKRIGLIRPSQTK